MTIVTKVSLFILLLIAVTVWLAVFTYPKPTFRLIACDVGQGDATLAIYGKNQILVDGGPGRKVLDCLSRYIPFWDRTIELVVMTHPEKDHFGGLIDVFKNYSVNNFITSGLDSGTSDFGVLEDQVGSGRASVHFIKSEHKIGLSLMHLDILHPSSEYIAKISDEKDLSKVDQSTKVLSAFTTTKNKNDSSVVAVLSFGEFDALFTGDIENEVSDSIADLLTLSAKREWEYIKIPHHGSRNGLSQKLLDAVDPEIAVISAGKNNSYGHPHKEVIRLLSDREIKYFRTDEKGDIIIESNGKSYWIK